MLEVFKQLAGLATGLIIALFQHMLMKREEGRRLVAERELSSMHAERDLAEDAVTSHSITSEAPAYYAFRIDRLLSSWTVAADGSGTVLDSYFGVHPTQATQDMQIPFFHSSGRSEATVTDPILMNASPGSEIVKPFSIRTPSEILGHLLIRGIHDENSAISFTLKIRFEHLFYLRAADALAAYATDQWRQEYVSRQIRWPTSTLEMTVRFPDVFITKGFNPVVVVFFARTEIIHHKETARLVNSHSLAIDGNQARLRVDQPYVGLNYAISWLPPA